ncbi:hypothetical protein CsatA_018782 [Cannabis sativa]|uniref:Kinesin motor domain-containing protein n=1 Tax=Cannabis sativa TaxID=3483 RepID=A0A803NRZ3_CANSA
MFFADLRLEMNPSQHPAATTSPKLRRSDSRFFSVSIDWECINDTTIIYRNNLSVSERSMYPTAYTFDRVFSFDSSTRQVYQEGAKNVALSVVGG